MHIERIHFDKVFDVQSHARTFSFTDAGQTHYAVQLPGRVIPHEGATYAVALARPGDWTVTEVAWWLLCALAITLAKTIQPWLLLLLPCAIVGMLLHLRRRNGVVRQALLATA